MGVCLLFHTLAAALPVICGGPPAPHKCVLGSLDATHVYMCGTTGQGRPVVTTLGGGGALTVLRTRVDCTTELDARILPLMVLWDGGSPPPLRWQLAGSHLAAVEFMPFGMTFAVRAGQLVRMPLHTLDLCPLVTATKMLPDAHARECAFKRVTQRGRFDPYDDELAVTPVERKPKVQFDFCLGRDGQAEAYVLGEGRVLRYDGAADGRGRWKETARWATDLDEPFYAAGAIGRACFVTASGKVLAPARQGGRLREVRSGPPIRVLLRDTVTSEAYAFTERDWFRVGEMVLARPHTIEAFPQATAEEAMRTMLVCAKVVCDMRQVSVPAANGSVAATQR